jgi:LPS export ABC transporter protein LptC
MADTYHLSTSWRVGVLILLIGLSLSSCVNDVNEVNELTANEVSINRDTAREVRILYSDSAQVQVEITAPTLVRHHDKTKPRDEFPDGLFVKFYNDKLQVRSWLKADYAVKLDKEDIIIARNNVELFNAKDEKLESPELIWNEQTGILETEKIVRITKANGDVTYGSGFTANEDFTRFEIKRNYSAKMSAKSFNKTL